MTNYQSHYLPSQPEFWSVDAPLAIRSRAYVRHHDSHHHVFKPDDYYAVQSAYTAYRRYLADLSKITQQPDIFSEVQRPMVKALLDREQQLVTLRLTHMHEQANNQQYSDQAKISVPHQIKAISQAILSEKPATEHHLQVVQQLRLMGLHTFVTVVPDGTQRCALTDNTPQEAARLPLFYENLETMMLNKFQSCNGLTVHFRSWDPLSVPSGGVTMSAESWEATDRNAEWTSIVAGALGSIGIFHVIPTENLAIHLFFTALAFPYLTVSAFSLLRPAHNTLTVNQQTAAPVAALIATLKNEQQQVGTTWDEVFTRECMAHDWLRQMTYRLSYPHLSPISIKGTNISEQDDCAQNDQHHRSLSDRFVRHTGVAPQDFYVLTRICMRYSVMRTMALGLHSVADAVTLDNKWVDQLFASPIHMAPKTNN